jgi:hypothetical protein
VSLDGCVALSTHRADDELRKPAPWGGRFHLIPTSYATAGTVSDGARRAACSIQWTNGSNQLKTVTVP